MVTKLFYLLISIVAINLGAFETIDRTLEVSSNEDRIASKEYDPYYNDHISNCWSVTKNVDSYTIRVAHIDDQELLNECVSSNNQKYFRNVDVRKLPYLVNDKNQIINEPIENIISRYLSNAYGCQTSIQKQAGIYEPDTIIGIECEYDESYEMTLKTNYYAEGDSRFYSDNPEEVSALVDDIIEDIANDPINQKKAKTCFYGKVSDDQAVNIQANNEKQPQSKMSAIDLFNKIHDCDPSLLSNFIANNGNLTRLRRGYKVQHSPSQGLKAKLSVEQDIRMAEVLISSVPGEGTATAASQLTKVLSYGKKSSLYTNKLIVTRDPELVAKLMKKGAKVILQARPSVVPAPPKGSDFSTVTEIIKLVAKRRTNIE